MARSTTRTPTRSGWRSPGYFFEKTVANLTTGANPTTTAAAGHTLRYTLRLQSADETFTNVRIYDELDALNALPAFVPGTLNLVSWPAGADVSNTSSTGGAKGTGVIDIRNLNVGTGGQIQIQFDVTLASTLTVGTVVTNQSALRLTNNTPRAVSDDPNVNGPADPDVAGDEDPTRVVIAPTALVFQKTVANVTSGANPAAEASPGDRLRYRLRLENLADFALSGVTVRDEIDRLNADAAFQPGTLTVITVPAGANASNTNATGGASGTGVLDVRNLTLAPSGGTAIIEFEVTLAPVITNGTDVLNQSQLLAGAGAVIAQSDDPNINGADDPNLSGDEDPTRIRIVSEPAFRVQKISTDMTGDPAILLAGETLRYTITVKNTGTSDATGVRLRDQIPVNTSYVAGSTTLERRADRGCRGHVSARRRHADQRAHRSDTRRDAGRCVRHAGQRRHDHVRRRHRPERHRRHRDLEPGLRDRDRRRHRRPAVRRSCDAGCQRSDAGHRRQPAAALCREERRPVRRPGLTGCRRSG